MSLSKRYRYFWDEEKAASNFKKHGVRFSTAVRVFDDPCNNTEFDAAHSLHEDRWTVTGFVDPSVLYVVYTVRCEDRIRIISARKANKDEQRKYYRVRRR